jgi:hypothetical protein
VPRSFKRDEVKIEIKSGTVQIQVSQVTCPAWELAADTYLLKFQRLKNKVLRTIGNFPRFTPVRDLHTAFNLPYVYDYIIKLWGQQAEVIQNLENEHVRGITAR